jgi:hypothetical protein
MDGGFNLDLLDENDLQCDGLDGDDSGEASGEAAAGAGHSDRSTSGGGLAGPPPDSAGAGGDAVWSIDDPISGSPTAGVDSGDPKYAFH